ncbi:MAG: hypothetical protein ACYC5Y_05545 [Symbiobacteriia bacterium]
MHHKVTVLAEVVGDVMIRPGFKLDAQLLEPLPLMQNRLLFLSTI